MGNRGTRFPEFKLACRINLTIDWKGTNFTLILFRGNKILPKYSCRIDFLYIFSLKTNKKNSKYCKVSSSIQCIFILRGSQNVNTFCMIPVKWATSFEGWLEDYFIVLFSCFTPFWRVLRFFSPPYLFSIFVSPYGKFHENN